VGQVGTRCGVVALIGAPNVGKSTLLNAMLGSKVSIVTHKVQTTRARVRGIAIRGDAQIIFIDTPGIFEPRRRLERAMVAAAWSVVGDADITALLYDARREKRDPDTRRILEGLRERGARAVLVLNKIDLVKRENLLRLAADFEAEGLFDRIFMISAYNGDGVGDLLDYFAETVPEGVWLYPEDQISDLPLRLLAAEITREKLFLRLHQELPYGLTVETESWQEFKNGDVRIQQVVYLSRPQHKAMCLGKGGQRIKEIRESAQRELEQLLECRVHLFLHLKVRENWIEDPERYRYLGLEFNP
jgi:GTP-binding protein Era